MTRPGSTTSNGRTNRVLPIVLARFPGLYADAITTFAVPVLVYTATGDADLSGLTLAIQWAPRVVLMPVIGVFVDRFDARRQLVASDAVRAALCLIPTLFPHVAVFVGAACLLMLVDSHGTIATENVLAGRVDPAAVPSAQSGLQTATQVSRTAGPATAGLLLGLLDARLTFLVCAGVFALGALGTLRVMPGPGPATPEVEQEAPATGGSLVAEALQSLAAGARTSLGTPALRALLMYAVLVNLVGGALIAILPPLVIGRYGSSESALGTVTGAATAGSIVAAAILATVVRRRPDLRLWPQFVGLLVVSAIGLCLAPSIISFAIAYGLWSIGITIFNVWLRARRLRLIPPGEVGRTLGFFVAAMLAAVPLGGLVLAVFGSVAAPQTILRAVVIATAVVAACVLAPMYARNRASHSDIVLDPAKETTS